MTQTILKSASLLALFIAAIMVITFSATAQTTTSQRAPQSTSPNSSAEIQPAGQRTNSLDEPEGEALFNGPLRSTGYGALGFKFTPIQGNFGTMLGGYGGWFINKTLLIGGGGYGLTSQIPSATRTGQNISFGYGGIVLEYVGLSDKVFHYAVQGFVGWGGAGFYTPGTFVSSRSAITGLMVFEPSVLAELNVTNFLRLSAGAGYRIVTGSTLEGLNNADLSSYSVSLNIKFGSF
jgi:hypothetical protein